MLAPLEYNMKCAAATWAQQLQMRRLKRGGLMRVSRSPRKPTGNKQHNGRKQHTADQNWKPEEDMMYWTGRGAETKNTFNAREATVGEPGPGGAREGAAQPAPTPLPPRNGHLQRRVVLDAHGL